MKIKAYDKYGKQHLIIEFSDDELYTDSTSSRWSSANVRLNIVLDDEWYTAHPDEYAEDPEFKRWSDLTDVEIINE